MSKINKPLDILQNTGIRQITASHGSQRNLRNKFSDFTDKFQ